MERHLERGNGAEVEEPTGRLSRLWKTASDTPVTTRGNELGNGLSLSRVMDRRRRWKRDRSAVTSSSARGPS